MESNTSQGLNISALACSCLDFGVGPEASGFSVTGREKEFLPVVGGASSHMVTPREAEQLVSEHSRGEPWAGKKRYTE